MYVNCSHAPTSRPTYQHKVGVVRVSIRVRCVHTQRDAVQADGDQDQPLEGRERSNKVTVKENSYEKC